MLKIRTIDTVEKLDTASFMAIYNLILKHKHALFDDGMIFDQTPFMERIYGVFLHHMPYFWIFDDAITGKPQGFCYLYDKMYSKNQLYSASATICFAKTHLGQASKQTIKILINRMFNKNMTKIKAECFSTTPYIAKWLESMGFKREGILKNETIVKKKQTDLEIWAIQQTAKPNTDKD